MKRTLNLFAFSLLASLIIGATAFCQAGDPLPTQAGGILTTATTPVNGTNEIQTITFGGTPTGGTFQLTFAGKTTAAITWSSTNSTLVSRIDTALEALANIGTSGVTTAVGTMTSGIGTITVTFTGNNAKLDVALMTGSSSLTGSSPTLAIATTTAGVTADGRSTALGQLLVDLGNKKLYQNKGTSLNPSWSEISGDFRIVYSGTHSWAGGAATSDAKTISGLLSTDVAVCSLRAAASSETLVSSAPTANTLTFVLSANGTNTTTKIDYVVFRAIP